MGKLWDIVQTHMDGQRYGVSQRRIAASLGISPTALGNWRDPKALPSPANLHALANLTGTPYLRVLDAALEDAGYIPRAGEHRGNTAPINPAGVSPASTAPVDQTGDVSEVDYMLAASEGEDAAREFEGHEEQP